MTACNLLFLFRQIAFHFNNLHSVKEGTRNGVEAIGCGNEHDLAQVIVNV